MIKQLCIKHINGKIRFKSPPNSAPSPTCLNHDVTHFYLTTGVVALHIPSRRCRERDERRHVKLFCQLMQKGWFDAFKNDLYEISNRHKHSIIEIHHWYFWISLTVSIIRFPVNHTYTSDADDKYDDDRDVTDTVKPVYNDHLMGYFSAFWGPSRWPRAGGRNC